MFYPTIILLIIVLIKAIFSASDTAFTFLNRAEINQLSKKDKKAEKIKILMEDSNKFFGIIEVVINMCELLAGAVVSLTLVEYLIDVLEKMQIATNIAALISVVISTVILSYIMLVFGGVLPKRIARNNPKKVAYSFINILLVVAKLNYPFERLIDFSTDLCSKLFKIKEEPEEKLTEKQIKMIIKEAKDEGVLEKIENRILLNTLKSNNIKVEKIMVPLDETYMINMNNDLDKILNSIMKNKYTRIPVFKKNKTNIIGILYVKEMAIKYAQEKIENKEQLENILRKPQYIKKDQKILYALKELQKNDQIMGIVCDNDNIPVGIISIEDVLEKLVGEIFDEDDK